MLSPSEDNLNLAELASRFELPISGGDDSIPIRGVCALAPGRPGHIAYIENTNHLKALADTRAAAVIAPKACADASPVPVLIAGNARLAFAQVAALFEAPLPEAGIHPDAVIAANASVAASANVGAYAVIGAGSVIGEHCVIGAGVSIGDNVRIGRAARIASRVTIESGCRIGARVRIEAGAVIGARGFGLVHDGARWHAVPQLGAVCIGDDVEVGAGTTIDRGALDDTRIEHGVKLDNQVHIGHNCVIGENTVVAGCTGIAGSCRIGAECMIGGGVGIGDHVTIADEVVLTAASQVPSDINAPGVYSSTFKAMPAAKWRKCLALFRRLDKAEHRGGQRPTKESTNRDGQQGNT